jgi:hypothetical protein
MAKAPKKIKLNRIIFVSILPQIKTASVNNNNLTLSCGIWKKKNPKKMQINEVPKMYISEDGNQY